MEEGSSSNMTDTVDSINPKDGKRLGRMETMLAAFKESQLIGREDEKSEIIKMISNRHNKKFEVISICGMGGLGKTSLVKDVYESQKLIAMFEKCACITVMRPFILKEFLRSLIVQLSVQSSSEKKGSNGFWAQHKKHCSNDGRRSTN